MDGCVDSWRDRTRNHVEKPPRSERPLSQDSSPYHPCCHLEPKARPTVTGSIELDSQGRNRFSGTVVAWCPLTDFTRAHGVVRFTFDDKAGPRPIWISRFSNMPRDFIDTVVNRADDRKCAAAIRVARLLRAGSGRGLITVLASTASSARVVREVR